MQRVGIGKLGDSISIDCLERESVDLNNGTV